MWIGYEFYEKKNMEAFWDALEKQGYDHADSIVQQFKQRDTAFKLPESDVNDLGFILLGKDRKKEAVAVLQYNLDANPGSANAYEGLAETYDTIGEKALALKNYKRSVALNPGNGYAIDRIKKLESGDK